jgi:DNA-nicking Smr family endonuclease
MKPALEERDLRLWRVVAATVRPLRPSPLPPAPADATAPPTKTKASPAKPKAIAPSGQRQPHRPAAGPGEIEPGRRRRIDRGRDQPAAVIDLHGMTQDQARASLTGFLMRAAADGRRLVLVITGKGALGDGVLRRRAPEWLAEPPLRSLVAGVANAHRRHGGEGALYVALKRTSNGNGRISLRD